MKAWELATAMPCFDFVVSDAAFIGRNPAKPELGFRSVAGNKEVANMEQQTAESKTDSKTILVVDDDQAILKFISGFLPQSGFNVLFAGTGEDALKQSRDYNGPIHLLLSNLQMPGMTGLELGTKLTLERPDIRVMLMSGFTSGMLVLNSGWQFLSKPFVASQLRESISNVLASPSSVDVPDIDERKEMIPR